MEPSVWSDEWLDERFARIDARFDEVDKRFDRVDARLDRVDARLDRVDVRFDRIDAQMHAGFTTIRRDMFQGAIALFGSQAALLTVLIAQSF